MGQIKHKMGKVGGGVDISHKSKMSGKAKSLMSFPGGMPGPGDYGQMEQPAKIVGKGMARYLAGESVGMKKYSDAPMTSGGPALIDPPKTKKKLKSVTGQQKRLDALSQKDKDMIEDLRQKRKEQNANNKKMQNSYITSSGPGKTDPKDGVVVSGDKDKVNDKITKTNTKAKKIALLKEQRAIAKAKALEKVNEQKNLNQVNRDLLKNQKLQKKRELQGKDYQANTGKDNQKTVRRS